MKKFLDIIGLSYLYNKIRNLKQLPYKSETPIVVGFSGDNKIYEVFFYINMSIPYTKGLMNTLVLNFPSYMQNASFITVVPEKTSISVSGMSISVNGISEHTTDGVNSFALCIHENKRLLASVKISNGSDGFTGTNISGYITFRYY